MYVEDHIVLGYRVLTGKTEISLLGARTLGDIRGLFLEKAGAF